MTKMFNKKINSLAKTSKSVKFKRGLFIILSILIGLTAVKLLFGNATAVLADAYIKFDEGYGTSNAVNDSNVTISAGTITNAVWKTEDLCRTGKCLYFDGTGDYVTFADNANLDMGAGQTVTVEGWFRTPDISSGSRTIISKVEVTGADGGYALSMNSSGQVEFAIDNDNNSFPSDLLTSPLSYDDNKWHYFAAVKNGATSISLYMDGVLVGTDSSIQNDLSNDDAFYVGIYNASSNGFNGFIDEIKVLRTARTADQIKADFTGETTSRGTTVAIGPNNSWISSGLLAYWKMDEASWTNNCSTDTVMDSSGNGINGDACSTAGGAQGKFGKAGEFDGTDDYVTFGDNSLLEINFPITLSAWINIDQLPSIEGDEYEIFSKYGGAGLREFTWLIETDDSLNFWSSYNGTNGEYGCGIAFSSADINSWVHAAVSIDKDGVLKCFRNGILVDTDTTTNITIFHSTASANIGRRSTGINYTDGQIDELRVYNRNLSPNEITNLYNWAPGPVANWKMDENFSNSTANTVYDSSGNGFHLTTGTGSSGYPQTTTGKYSNSLDPAQGTQDHNHWAAVSDPSNGLLDQTGPMTVTTWIYYQSGSSCFSGNPSAAVTKGLADISTQTQHGFLLGITGTGGSVCALPMFRVSPDGTASNATTVTGTTVLNSHTWYHLAGVYTGSALQIYVNGVLDASTSYSSGIFNNTGNFTIGGHQYSGGGSLLYDFPGRIDDVHLYSYAHTPGQLIADMQGDYHGTGTLKASPVAYWKFDEGYGDTVRNSGLGGTTFNGDMAGSGTTCPAASSACPTWSNSGKMDKALEFDGTNDYIDIGDKDFTSAITISAWIYWDATTCCDGIVAKRSDTEASGHWAFNLDGSGLGLLEFAVYSADNVSTSVRSTTTIPTGRWTHVAVSFDNSTNAAIFYINGKREDGSGDSMTNNISDTSQSVFIGRARTTGEYFDGKIDELKIYNTVLTGDQIAIDINQGAAVALGAKSTDATNMPSQASLDSYCPPGQGSTCTAPVAEWKMDENGGQKLNDSSGNGNDSTTWSGNTRYEPGKYGPGLYFDGTNDVVRVNPTLTSLDNIGGTSDSYSVSAWFKTSATGNTQNSIVTKNKDNSGVFPFNLYVATSPQTLNFSLNDGSACTAGSAFTVLVSDGKWHFGVGVWDTTTNVLAVYVDGVLLGSTSCGEKGATNNTDDISIGNGRQETITDYENDDFFGYIDQVRIYNYVRTQEQIAWEFTHGKPTFGWFKLDDNVTGNSKTIGDSGPWLKNATTTDSGGTTLDCTITGVIDKACDFDGTNDSINLGNHGVYQANFSDGADFSVAGWFYRDTFTTDDLIVGKRVDQASTSDGWMIWIDDATDKFMFEAADTVANGSDEYSVQSESFFDSTTNTGWNHFVFTWDDDTESNIKLYINGQEENLVKSGTLANIGTIIGASRNMRIGAAHGGTTDAFDGKIDDIMFFSGNITEQQVADIYNQGAVRFGPNN